MKYEKGKIRRTLFALLVLVVGAIVGALKYEALIKGVETNLGLPAWAQPYVLAAMLGLLAWQGLKKEELGWPEVRAMVSSAWQRAAVWATRLVFARGWYEARIVLGYKRQPTDPGWGLWGISQVMFPTLESLIQRSEKVRRYFAISGKEALSVEVVIGEGYLLDRFLLWGIMDNYDETWAPVIGQHHSYMDSRKNALRSVSVALEFEHFRRSQFICWLLWGPSIPSCTCHRWTHRTENGVHNTKGVEIAWQFAFGDENNSVFLCLNASTQAYRMENMRGLITRITNGRFAIHNPAHQTIAEHVNLMAADSHVRDEPKRLYLKPAKNYQVLLDTDFVRERYFTAYIWFMLVCVVVPKDRSEPIRFAFETQGGTEESSMNYENLLPFFVHANVFDVKTDDIYADMLVSQAMAAIERFEQASYPMQMMDSADLVFIYGGAIDDSLHENADAQKLSSHRQRARIRDMLFERRDQLGLQSRLRSIGELLDIPDLRPADRQFIADLPERVTPCQFPAIFKSYYADIDEDKCGKEEKQFAA